MPAREVPVISSSWRLLEGSEGGDRDVKWVESAVVVYEFWVVLSVAP